ncbi:SDR family oxidoreductase [Wenxinia marina]|uniref:Dehydrogenase n=1 Tax=Wenxinia marina DSM 24838 TaxID=1123501 RepID=A0A0D0QC93_9RHOB|nr:SDR family oxidoreductase [Wenxinia marina]KIQ69942.1 Dehydrogenase [Wenxinia marina DSM 24838]GGL62340.1 NAD(P)-dependent oxidoreductase [Wenxinia marina]
MTEHAFPPQHQDSMPADEHEMTPAPDYTPRFPGVGKLKDKVAFVSGGDSGIGRAVSVLFAREGAKVAIAYLEEHEDAEETKRLVEAEGSEALLIPGDLGQRAHAFDAIARTVERFGKLDVLVNNCAQQWVDDPLEDLSEERLRRTMDSNVMAQVFVTQAALAHLKEGAAIVNTTSVNAFKGNDSLIAYSTTRGATLAFSRSIAKALIKRGIRVNAVAPGPIWTPFIPGSMDAETVAGFGTQTEMGRAGQPWEVATAYLFLASEDGSYFNGQTLHPNGGTIVGA